MELCSALSTVMLGESDRGWLRPPRSPSPGGHPQPTSPRSPAGARAATVVGRCSPVGLLPSHLSMEAGRQESPPKLCSSLGSLGREEPRGCPHRSWELIPGPTVEPSPGGHTKVRLLLDSASAVIQEVCASHHCSV